MTTHVVDGLSTVVSYEEGVGDDHRVCLARRRVRQRRLNLPVVGVAWQVGPEEKSERFSTTTV